MLPSPKSTAVAVKRLGLLTKTLNPSSINQRNFATATNMAATTNGTQTSVHVNGTSGGGAEPKIHLYTNHRCPFAHRAHIVLEELGLPFEETIIDLNTPRPQW